MFRQAANVAILELALYTAIAAVSMVKAGQGSGVFIVFLPVLWFVLAVRLWAGLWIASALSPESGVQFLVAATAIGLISTIFVSLLVAGNIQEWSGAWIFVPSLLAHVGAALLVLRSQPK